MSDDSNCLLSVNVLREGGQRLLEVFTNGDDQEVVGALSALLAAISTKSADELDVPLTDKAYLLTKFILTIQKRALRSLLDHLLAPPTSPESVKAVSAGVQRAMVELYSSPFLVDETDTIH